MTDEYSKEAIRQAAMAELKRRLSEEKQLSSDEYTPVAYSGSNGVSEELRQAAIAELKRRGKLEEVSPPAEEFSWPIGTLEAAGRGAFSLPDLAQAISFSGAEAGRKSIASAREAAAKNLGVSKEPSPDFQIPIESPSWKPSDIIPHTQIPSTPLQRIGMKAAEMAGASAIPIGGMAGLARNTALGAGMGAGSGVLQEAGAPPLVADIAALGAGMVAPRMVKNAFRGLSPEEKKVAETFQGFVGEKELPNVIRNLENRPIYTELPGYEPMTAEVANNPSVSQFHRSRLGIPGSGLQDRAALQNEALMSKIEEHSLKASPSSEIKENIARELKARESIRRGATKEGYEYVEKMDEKISPRHLLEFLDKKPAAGTIKKDLNSIRKELMPTNKASKVDFEYQKLYEKSSSEFKKKMPTPESLEPKVSQLAALDADLTAKIEKLKSSGQKKRATILKQAQEELRKDLDIVQPYKEARSQYAELSKPVNEISQHPTLKSLPKNKVNNIMNHLFDKKSEDNLMQLKKVLGNNPEQWEGIQHATTSHLKNRIMNAQSEGRSHVLSYPKMKRFMESHENALKEVYNPDQMEVIKSIEKALHGQNVAKTKGQGIGSDTQAKQAIDKMTASGLGIKGLELASKGAKVIPVIGKPIRNVLVGGLEFIAERNEKRLVDILDKSLRDPEFAHKLLSHRFNKPIDVSKFANDALVSTSVLARERKKED